MEIIRINSSNSLSEGPSYSMEIVFDGSTKRIDIDQHTYLELSTLFDLGPRKKEPVPDNGNSKELLRRLIDQGRSEIQEAVKEKDKNRVLSPFEKVGFGRVDEVVQFSADMIDNDDELADPDPGEQYHDVGEGDSEVEQF